MLDHKMEGAVRPKYTPAELDGQPLQLVQVHVFFRHGDRSPTPSLGRADRDLWSKRLQEVPPRMPLRQYHYQERPFGYLTKKGAEQARSLGIWIKNAYLDDLRVTPVEPTLQVRSTNFLRTHMSAWFVLEGLLGSSEAAASVPVGILEERDENLYHNDHCPRLAKLWRAVWMSRRKTQVLPDGSVQETGWCIDFEDIRLSLAKHLDLPTEARFPWVLAADAANCAVCHGDPLPENVTEEKLAGISRFLAEDYVSTFQDKEICELSMGRLLREVVDAMLQRKGPSLYLYSGHDATIVPLSVSLGLPWKSWPPYAASISIELWSSTDGDELYVRVLYDGSEVALPVDLPGIECTWQPRDCAEGSGKEEPKKSLYTFQEFLALAGWSMLTDAEFEKKCNSDAGLEELSVS